MTSAETPYAYVLFDGHQITELVCANCATDEDDTTVAIFEQGTIICDRCGEMA